MTPASTDAGADTSDYARLRDLFDAVTDVPAAERSAWLDAQALAPAMRVRLERLIEADTDRGALDLSVRDRATQLSEMAFEPERLLGTRICAFRLVRLIGQGGMAAVFLGERDEADFAQQVAVKLLRRGLYSEIEQRRFLRERRALAALSHPNIAHLIDGGITDAGVPYLVLEYVDGVPITDYATTQQLEPRARLRLFALACRAVAAAHRRLIVHRDLKPSNLLIDREGRPKLLDFGIAKLLDEDDEAATRAGPQPMTPGYAAPEQFAGGPITAATDVHALGVLLHELLTGQRPDARHTGTARASDALDALVLERAGLSLALPAMQRFLRGEVDTILQTALAPEPERRYASAAELADDIDAFLGTRPIAAHPPSTRYRLRKFVQRHRGAMALGAAFLLGLVASLAVALWQAREARQQAQLASEVQGFMEELFQPIEDGSALTQAPTLHDLLQRGVERIDRRYPDDAEVRADLLALFARLQDGIGEASSIRTLAADAWHANVVAYGEDDERTWQARLLHARVLRVTGDLDAALSEYRAVLAQLQRLDVRGQEIARVLDSISLVRMAQGVDADEAIALKREVLDARLADPEVAVDDLAAGYNNLGAAYHYAARFDEALSWYGKALDLGLRESGDHRVNANTLSNIGAIESYQGRLRDAADTLARARAMYARIPIERSANLVSLLLRQCMVLGQLERHADARIACDDAVAMSAEVQGAHHPQHALALARRGGAAVSAGRLDAAEADYAQARAIARDDATQRIIDSDQARLSDVRGDWPRLRDSALAQIDRAASRGLPFPGTQSPSAPLFAAWAALACGMAPETACGGNRIATADAILADPRFAASVLRYGASVALARLHLDRGDPAAALRRLDASTAWADPDLAPDHSWRAEHALLRWQALRALGETAAPKARHEAERLLQGLPEGHPLRARVAFAPASEG